MFFKYITVLSLVFSLSSFLQAQNKPAPAKQTKHYKKEKHLKKVQQLTYGGDNAEAYWSFDSKNLVFQSNNPGWGLSCDQIFTMVAKEQKPNKQGIRNTPNLLSTGKGRTTCSYYMPDGKSVIYASTHLKGKECPPEPPKNGKYVWMLYPEFDIFQADLKGNVLKQLTETPHYDAEATVSPKGDKIVFTSMRTGDPELFTMNLDGSDVRQVTKELGYDGGAFFSPDGTKLIVRASRPTTSDEITEYKSLIAQDMVQPTKMELFMCNVDGSDLKQITKLGGANWAPFMHPSGNKILFSSNHMSPRGFPFNIFMINVDGTGLEQITFDNAFDSFPMFSFDGKKIAFSSNRNNGGTRDTNVFVAKWKD
ncbi:MAG: PD40 domain-containing protein [Saprospiraceae bacterium]|nr:PD40 domain-containing protein [Candidatus Brachybacter algidus]